jgi:ectoine hydroxylase-related dioxygenase (phytanoyl-CoA dioxygenase family)
MCAYPVTDRQITEYDRDGITYLPGLLKAHWIERCRAGIERSLVDAGTGESSDFFKRLRLWERDKDLRDFCFTSRMAEVAAQLMQTDRVRLLYDQAFVKEPGTNAPTPWHNDQPYWPVRGTQVLTFWIALDPVTAENGALEFIKGSHRQNKWYRPWDVDDSGNIIRNFIGDGDEDFEDLPDFGANRAAYDIVSWDMQPGDALAFHALTVHGAPGNTRKDLRRRGYAVRMTGDDARYFAGKVWNSYIMDEKLKTGDPLESAQYPMLYEASAAR